MMRIFKHITRRKCFGLKSRDRLFSKFFASAIHLLEKINSLDFLLQCSSKIVPDEKDDLEIDAIQSDIH